DNTTRKLMADGRRPLATGFFFALGHSSVIMAAGAGLAIAARAVFGAVVDPDSGYETLGGGIGTSLAATVPYPVRGLHAGGLGGGRVSAAWGRACLTGGNSGPSFRPGG